MTDKYLKDHENEKWYQELLNPVRRAIYLQDPSVAKTALSAALDGIDRCALDDEMLDMLKYRMCWYRFVVDTLDREDVDALPRFYQQALDCVQPKAATGAGDFERRRILVILKSIEHEYTCTTTTRDEMEELIDGLPGLEKDEFLWHALAGWAFIARDEVILARAFEVHLTEPSSELGQAKWQRINLMYQLVAGKATRRDLIESIASLIVLPQLTEFIEMIWPVCTRQGLVDDELKKMLEEKIKQIDIEVPPIPSRERKTKSIRNS